MTQSHKHMHRSGDSGVHMYPSAGSSPPGDVRRSASRSHWFRPHKSRASGEPTKNGPFWRRLVSDDLNTRLVPVQASRFSTKISIRIKQTQGHIIHEFCCLLNKLLSAHFVSMFRRLLQEGLYRVRGNMFVPLHKVGLASHMRHGNFGESTIPLRGRPDDKN
jgi:hypothetical protein